MAKARMASIIIGATAIRSLMGDSQLSIPLPMNTFRYGGQDPGIEVIEELRIGSLEGPEHETFAQIVDLSVGADGSIYVADEHPPRMLEFDRDGRFVRQIGGEGAGPGEYRSILGISAVTADWLAIWDFGNRRISVYDTAGVFLRSFRVEGGAFGRKAFRTDTAGRFYVKVHHLQQHIPVGGPVPQSGHAYMRLAPDGSVLDTISLPPENPTGGFLGPDDNGTILRPFIAHEVYALSPFGSLIVGSNQQNSFTVRDPLSPITFPGRTVSPVPVKDEEFREWEMLKQYLERLSGMSFRSIPREKPLFRDLWVDADGRVWVHRFVEAAKRDLPEHERTRSGNLRPNITWREPPVFDVYKSDGEFLWCVHMPWGARVIQSRGSMIWGTIKGSLDEEYVVRWRIP